MTTSHPVVTSDAIGRLGEVIARKLRAPDPYRQQRHARRFIYKLVVTADTITISGTKRPFENALIDGPEHEAPMVPSIAREWCRLGDSNT